MNTTTDKTTPAIQAAARSFIDLRRFAADETSGQRVSLPAGSDAFLARRRQLFAYDAPMDVGAIDLPAGQGHVAELAQDEFVFVCDGAVRLAHDGNTVDLREGQCAILPRGSSVSWRCERATSVVYMRCQGPATAGATLLPVDDAAPLAPSGTPPVELLVGAVPSCQNHTDFRSANGEFTCGTWASTPYYRQPMLYPHCELMFLLEGAVTLQDEAGRSHTFGQHDLFVVEQGARCSWDSRVSVKKVYAIYRPVA